MRCVFACFLLLLVGVSCSRKMPPVVIAGTQKAAAYIEEFKSTHGRCVGRLEFDDWLMSEAEQGRRIMGLLSINYPDPDNCDVYTLSILHVDSYLTYHSENGRYTFDDPVGELP